LFSEGRKQDLRMISLRAAWCEIEVNASPTIYLCFLMCVF
jgi:hypothetical protein